jgi:hypothetical protein
LANLSSSVFSPALSKKMRALRSFGAGVDLFHHAEAELMALSTYMPLGSREVSLGRKVRRVYEWWLICAVCAV